MLSAPVIADHNRVILRQNVCLKGDMKSCGFSETPESVGIILQANGRAHRMGGFSFTAFSYFELPGLPFCNSVS